MKYYAFDWDDNILKVPTKIKMLYKGKELNISTQQFAEIRNEISKGEWELSKNAFEDFRESGDQKFLKDIMNSETSYSWNDFVECVNNACLFSIITARGHKIETFKQAIKQMIKSNYKGLDYIKIIGNIKKYAFNRNIETNDLLDYYLKYCKFYPVSNPNLFKNSNADNPSELKMIALQDFVNHVIIQSNKYRSNLIKFGGETDFTLSVGFSDDDEGNIDLITKNIGKIKEKYQGVKFVIKSTNNKNI